MWQVVVLCLCLVLRVRSDGNDYNFHDSSEPNYQHWAPDVYTYSFVNVRATSTMFFADFVGINSHGTNYDGAYHNNKTAIFNYLRQAGIRHLRMGLLPDHTEEDLIDFGNQGFKMSLSCDGPETYTPAQIVAAIKRVNANFTARGLEPVIVLMEGPNEPDNFWVGQYARTYLNEGYPLGPMYYLRDCYNALKGDSATSWIKVSGIASGVNNAYATQNLSMSNFVDWGNYHPYPYGGNSNSYPFNYTNIAKYYWRGTFPSSGIDEYPYVLKTSQIPYPGKPMMASEVGYMSISPSIVAQPKLPYTTFDVQAKYTPRLYLEHFRLGTKRIMLYEAADEDVRTAANYLSEESFGIMDGRAIPKPAYYAMKSLMTVLNDTLPPYPQANDDSYRTTVDSGNVLLSYNITAKRVLASPNNQDCIQFGDLCNVYNRMYMIHHVLMQRKATNDLFFVVWHEVSNTDTNPNDEGNPPTILTHPPIPITISLLTPLNFSQSDSKIYTYDKNYNYVAAKVTFQNSTTISMNALETVSVLQLRLTSCNPNDPSCKPTTTSSASSTSASTPSPSPSPSTSSPTSPPSSTPSPSSPSPSSTSPSPTPSPLSINNAPGRVCGATSLLFLSALLL